MLVQEQLERRRQRALEEIVRVTHPGGHPVFSSFEVTSVSGRRYRVQIRSLTELQNTCTCPDYRTNLLGTCKHIEGVLLYLKKKLGKRWAEFERQGSPATQVYTTLRSGYHHPRLSAPAPPGRGARAAHPLL